MEQANANLDKEALNLSKLDSSQAVTYQIRVKGHLDYQRTDWFENFSLLGEADGTTLITGSVLDQAALYGLLKKVRDLNIPLLSVNQIGAES